MPHQTVALKERLQYLGLAILTVFNTYVCASLVAAALAPLSDHQLLLNTVPLLCATLIVTALTVALLPRGSWPRIGLGRGVSRGVTVGLVLGNSCWWLCCSAWRNGCPLPMEHYDSTSGRRRGWGCPC